MRPEEIQPIVMDSESLTNELKRLVDAPADSPFIAQVG